MKSLKDILTDEATSERPAAQFAGWLLAEFFEDEEEEVND